MTRSEQYMHRCVALAQLAAGYVAPNPMVGAVLVHDDRIIGEGYHQLYGGPHAEVNCLSSVAAEDRHLISGSTLYVSLEPCAHHGKTPPCADLIIQHQIKKVVVGCRDPFKEVDGQGIDKLRAAGVDTSTGVLEKECRLLNARFLIFHTLHRPYIILKWAQTANGKIAHHHPERLRITGDASNRLVHQWRSEEAAILVGTNTAQLDDPQLTNRLWSGPSPTRLVLDLDLRLPPSLRLFNKQSRTIVFNTKKHGEEGHLLYYSITNDTYIVHQIAYALYQLNILSVMVEGGARLLQSFIENGSWDEARVIINQSMHVPDGVAAPELKNARIRNQERLNDELVSYYVRH